MTSQMDTAIAAARQLDDQASDYGDEVADEIDRASTLLADTLTKLEPVMDTGEDAMTKLTDATGNLKWAMREMAAEMLMASSALGKTSSGLDKVSDAAEDGRDGMSAISEGIKQLLESVDTGDDGAASQAISTILTGYDSLSAEKKSPSCPPETAPTYCWPSSTETMARLLMAMRLLSVRSLSVP